jgi:DNA-binding response OmpR family regulator
MILVAVQDESARRELTTAIQALSEDATVCTDGSSAWAAAQEGDYPIILLDWDLPDIESLG